MLAGENSYTYTTVVSIYFMTFRLVAKGSK